MLANIKKKFKMCVSSKEEKENLLQKTTEENENNS